MPRIPGPLAPLLALSLAACDAGTPPVSGGGAAGESEPPLRLVPGREVRLDAQGDLERFGFRDASDGGFAAGHAATHDVRVAAGVLRVTPRHLGQAGTAVELETRSVSRGGQALDLTALESTVDRDSGALEVVRAGVAERFENFEGGVEQSWRFHDQPPGAGDLVVEVAVRGHEYVATTERGLHFASPGGLGFRYSHAVWVGADGGEVEVAAVHDGGAIRLAVPADVLAATAFPAVLDPIVEPEVRVDRPVVGGAGDISDQAALSWSGSQYLAVWRQDIPDDSIETHMRAARIAADGTVLDPTGLDISGGTSDSPSATFFGGKFVVAYRRGGAVRLARVGVGGGVEAAGRIGEENGNCRGPDIASGATEAMIVYTRCGTTDIIQTVRHDGDTASSPVSLGASQDEAIPRIAASPAGDYLAVWADQNDDIRGRFIAPAGVPGAEVLIANGGGPKSNPDVAFAGSDFVVVWQRDASGTQQIRAVRVSPTGTVGGAVDVSSLTAAAAEPSVSCSADCLVTWRGGPDASAIDLRARRLAADLTALTDEWILVGGTRTQGPGAIAGAGGDHYLVWPDEESGLMEVHGATASDDGAGQLALGTDTLLATGASNGESEPAVATAPSSWLLAWADNRNGGSDIFGKRFGLDGIQKTPRAKPIHEGPDLQAGPRLVWNGSAYLAAWHNASLPRGVRAARVEANGTVLDPAGIFLGTGNYAFIGGVAGSPSGWLVSWIRQSSVGLQLRINMVGLDGTASAPVTVATGIAQPAAAAYDPAADLYVLVWLDGPTRTFLAIRVMTDGTVVDTSPVPIAALGGTHFYGAEMVYGGGAFLVAWRDGVAWDGDIVGARFKLGPSGIETLTTGAVPLVTSPENEGADLSLTFTARGYLLAFERLVDDTHVDIFGLQIATSGLVHGGPFLLAGGPGDEEMPVVAGAPGGRALLAYQRKSGSDPARVYVRRLLAAWPNGTTCTGGAQCESGFCADGRCCDQACGGAVEDCQACSVEAGAGADGICTLLAAGEFCRRRVDPFCDLAERCDGVTSSCPADLGTNQGAVCDEACGAVCPLADDSGSPHVCPTCPEAP